MRLLRFGAELSATALFTGGIFFLPLAFALVGRSLPQPAAPLPVPPAPVVHWTPPPSGGGLHVAAASNRGSDPVETGKDATGPTPSPTPAVQPRPSRPDLPTFAALAAARGPVAFGGHASYGTGGGRGGGTGGITMRRPPGHERPTFAGTTPQTRRAPRCEPQVQGIDMVAPDEYQVARQVVDEYANLRHARDLVGWVARHRNASGSMDGVQVGGIACGSPLHLAGIRNGDVVHTINGIEITGIPSALAAYHRLRTADVLDVSLTRHGRPVHVTYHLS